MMTSLRLAGAAALCAVLLLSACAKKTDQTTTASTDATTATTAPAADSSASAAPGATVTTPPEVAASTVPGATATTSSSTTTATTSDSGGSGGYITLPVYPGATDAKDNGSMTVSTNTGSLAMKSYTTADDAKKVADWYKGHLPASFKNAILTSDNKTNATFVNERSDGDQSVLVTSSDAGTRIQLTTKHGK